MHEKVISKKAVALLERMGKASSPLLEGWMLAGGTGLALQLGHRISDDFDFFRTDDFDVLKLHDILKQIGEYEMLQEDQRTLTVLMDGVKISFFVIKDPFLFEGVQYRFFHIADIRDIALMKLVAISGRGSRKDFIDLYVLLRGGISLPEYFALLPKKYGKGRDNAYHILKSLTYFEDAEQEPMPRMFEPFDWEECKRYFVRQGQAIVVPYSV